MEITKQINSLGNGSSSLFINLIISASVAYFLNLYFGSLASFSVLLLLVLASSFAVRKIGLRFKFIKFIFIPVLIITLVILILSSLFGYQMDFKQKFLITLPFVMVVIWNYTYKLVYKLKK